MTQVSRKFIKTALSIISCFLLIVGCTLSPIPAYSLSQQTPKPKRKAQGLSSHDKSVYVSQLAIPTLIATPSPSPTNQIKPTVTTTTPTSHPFAEGPITIGYSVDRRPIQIYRFGSGSIERLIVAGIHGGNEGNTIQLANELITRILNNPETIPDEITLYILPNLNPDGEALGDGPEGRLNQNGVDLNRNWPYNWAEDWSEDGCWQELPVSAGNRPASEPETTALLYFIQYHSIDALISYHCCALGIFAGGVPAYQPSIDLAQILAGVSSYQYPPIDTGCPYTGNLTDWAAANGVAAVDIELSNRSRIDFEQNIQILETFLEWRTP